MLKRWATFLAVFVLGNLGTNAHAAEGPYIFDWGIRDGFLSGSPDVTPVPHPGHDWPADYSGYQSLYNQLDTMGRPLSMMLQPDTNPLDGTQDPNALTTVMSYVPRLDFVWADFEDANQNAQMQKVIAQVRSNSNPAISQAYIGNYNDYAGAMDYSAVWPNQVDRSAADAFYRTSGENISNPSIYPYEYYANHTNAGAWGTNVAPNTRAALLWAPLERFSLAKRNLPAGDLLIPWTARFIATSDPGYVASPPPREDVIAMIQHIRLRGADGYYRLVSIVSDDPNFVVDPTEEAQDRQDMLDGWHSLDGIFSNSGAVHILNLDTDKISGLQWSGVEVGDQVAILISNLSDISQRILLPAIDGLPEYSDYVPANSHLLKFYNVPEPGSLAILGIVVGSGLCRRPRKVKI
jgi:hypothetical protein